MTITLGFALKVAGSDEIRDFKAVSTSFRCEGLLTLESDLLTIEWGGEARVQDVGLLSIEDERIGMPDEWVTVPVGHLARASLAGGWWRPRLMLEEREAGALSLVPSQAHGVVRFWYARRDRAVARTMVEALRRIIAAESPTSGRPT